VNFKQDFNQVKVGLNYHFGKDDVAVASTMPVKAAPAALFNWTGVYVGAAVADRTSSSTWTTTAINSTNWLGLFGLPSRGLIAGDPTTTPARFFDSEAQGRLYAGYNWQFSSKWVAGIEGDIGYGNSNMRRGGIPGAFGNGANPCSPFANGTLGLPNCIGIGATGLEVETSDSATVKLGWDGTIRGKLGMLVTPTILFYGTGGAAFQQVSVSAMCDASVNSWCFADSKGVTISERFQGSGAAGTPRSQTFSSVRVGWTAGLGIEGVLTGNWLGKAEVRYADFGRYNNTFFAGTGVDVVTSVHVSTVTALAGVSYKFGPTEVVAKY
jgi:outer membrane immunogenic protein